MAATRHLLMVVLAPGSRLARRPGVLGLLWCERRADGRRHQHGHLLHARRHRDRARRLCELLRVPGPRSPGTRPMAAEQMRTPAEGRGPMLTLLGLPPEASAHAAEIDQMIVLVHWLMFRAVRRLGRVLRVRAVPLPQRRQSAARAMPAPRERSRQGRRDCRRSRGGHPAGLLRDPRVGQARQQLSERAGRIRRPRDWRAVRVERPVSGRRRHVRAHRHPMLVSADNPLGLDRTDPNAKDDITDINQLTCR